MATERSALWNNHIRYLLIDPSFTTIWAPTINYTAWPIKLSSASTNASKFPESSPFGASLWRQRAESSHSQLHETGSWIFFDFDIVITRLFHWDVKSRVPQIKTISIPAIYSNYPNRQSAGFWEKNFPPCKFANKQNSKPHQIRSTSIAKMAQEVPTFKLVLVGDGGTGKVSDLYMTVDGP